MLRSLRYLEWTYDTDLEDTTITTDFAYILRDAAGVRVECDQHTLGLFPRATWLALLSKQGFLVSVEQFKPSEPALPTWDTFACTKPEPGA
jgi:hypothetical protein